MPLAFDSLSHGRIAFGFFNIEIDLLLLERLFFFAGDFCRAVGELAEQAGGEPAVAVMPGWRIDDPARIGNLQGAIQGWDLSGFIGRTYRRWPFPRREEEFKQRPEGWVNRAEAAEMIAEWAEAETIGVQAAADGEEASVGEYRFDRLAFQELIRYVYLGGMPRWRDGLRPDYVTAMIERVVSSSSPLMAGLGAVLSRA